VHCHLCVLDWKILGFKKSCLCTASNCINLYSYIPYFEQEQNKNKFAVLNTNKMYNIHIYKGSIPIIILMDSMVVRIMLNLQEEEKNL
jgi:hypothetical protein